LIPAQQTTRRRYKTGPAPVRSAPTQTFEEFLAGVRADALKAGIRKETLDAALAGLEPNPVVIARDRAQPEATQSLDDYLAARLTPTRIQTAVAMRQTHAALLDQIEKTYGLPPSMMVAFWGLESNFGAFVGTYQTISSLATLAYDGRRTIFRNELIAALKIVDDRSHHGRRSERFVGRRHGPAAVHALRAI
jgi:membrane-bound lytic murein transglycosylase B